MLSPLVIELLKKNPKIGKKKHNNSLLQWGTHEKPGILGGGGGIVGWGLGFLGLVRIGLAKLGLVR